MGSEGSASPNGCAVCGGMAAVYCTADAAALCVPCDAAVHAANLLASRHERVPLAAAMAATSGVYDLFAADDDVGSGSAASSWPMVVPPAHGQGSPNTNSSSSSFTNDSAAPASLFDLLSDVELMGMATGPAGASLSDGGAAAPLWLQAACTPAWTTSWSQSEALVVPSSSTVVAAAAADREARVQRYREKRKNRKFQKTIRYASRKAYAEARPRVKGRFVKRAAASSSSSSDDDTSTNADEGGAARFWLSFSNDSRSPVPSPLNFFSRVILPVGYAIPGRVAGLGKI